MRKLALMATVLVLTGALVGGVSASAVRVINGTPKNDVLVVGGSGKDRLCCGGGTDTANADAKDTVGSDCEVVKGLPAPAQPPAPTPPPPPPPLPAAPTAKAGHYCGFTNQGKSICFDVTGSSAANFATTSDFDCGIGILQDIGLSFTGSAPIQPDLTFTFSYSGPLGTQSGSRSPTSRRATA